MASPPPTVAPYLASDSHNLDRVIAGLPRDSLAQVASFFAALAKHVTGHAALHQPHRRSAGSPPPARPSGQNINNSDIAP